MCHFVIIAELARMMLPATFEDNNDDATEQSDKCDDSDSDNPVHDKPLSDGTDSDCSVDELDSTVSVFEILNRYCLKVKEEAMVSSKTMESVRQVTISLMKAQSNQCQRQVYKVLEKHGVDPASMPELEDAFFAFRMDT